MRAYLERSDHPDLYPDFRLSSDCCAVCEPPFLSHLTHWYSRRELVWKSYYRLDPLPDFHPNPPKKLKGATEDIIALAQRRVRATLAALGVLSSSIAIYGVSLIMDHFPYQRIPREEYPPQMRYIMRCPHLYESKLTMCRKLQSVQEAMAHLRAVFAALEWAYDVMEEIEGHARYLCSDPSYFGGYTGGIIWTWSEDEGREQDIRRVMAEVSWLVNEEPDWHRTGHDEYSSNESEAGVNNEGYEHECCCK